MTSFALILLECGLSVSNILCFHTQIPQRVGHTQKISFSITSSEGPAYAYWNFDRQTRNKNKQTIKKGTQKNNQFKKKKVFIDGKLDLGIIVPAP